MPDLPLVAHAAGAAMKHSSKAAAIYLRVSTVEQTVENQRPELEQLAKARGFSIAHKYVEQLSAAKRRPIFDAMLEDARRGVFKVLLVWSLDRFGRSMVGNLQAVLELDRLGVEVVSVREPWLDTGGPVRPLLVAIFSWVAEQERVRLGERTRAGLERARRQGKSLGRPARRIDWNQVSLLVSEGVPPTQIAKTIGVGRSTFMRAAAARRAQGAKRKPTPPAAWVLAAARATGWPPGWAERVGDAAEFELDAFRSAGRR